MKLQFTSLTIFWIGLLITTIGYVRFSNAITNENSILRDKVKELQVLLMRRNYVLPKFGADGKYGPETMNAVKAFQRDYMGNVTGLVTSNMLNLLENRNNINKKPELNNPSSLIN